MVLYIANPGLPNSEDISFQSNKEISTSVKKCMLSPAGEKQFSCNQCEKAFSTAKDL